MTRFVLNVWGGAAVMLGATGLAFWHGDVTTAALIVAGLIMFMIDYCDRMLARKPGARP